MPLSESEFQKKYTETLRPVEDALGALVEEHDFEMERQGDVLTLEWEDGSKFVISPNNPVRQIWMSAQLTSFKFDWSDQHGQFVHDKTAEPFKTLLARLVGEELATGVTFS